MNIIIHLARYLLPSRYSTSNISFSLHYSIVGPGLTEFRIDQMAFWSTWTYLFKHTKRTPFVKPRGFGQSKIRSIMCLPTQFAKLLIIFFLKWAFFFVFVYSIQLTVNVRYKFLPMTGFEPRTPGIGSDRSANWATPLPKTLYNLILVLKPPFGSIPTITKYLNEIYFICILTHLKQWRIFSSEEVNR